MNTITWAEKNLLSNGFTITAPSEIIQITPWSSITKFITNAGYFYLKQTPPALFLESKIIQLLTQLNANVPVVIASNEEFHCFLMKDAGQTLRKYLKTHFQSNLLDRAIKEFTGLQRLTENHIESFLALGGVPDWRLNKLPNLYEQLINQTTLLKTEGITEEELQILQNSIPNVSEQCAVISRYQIPETLVQPDFNTNNILFDSNTEKMTLIDLGEIAVTQPFFSLHNFLLQATIHHDVKKHDQIYYQLQNTCCENWLELSKKNDLLEVFMLVKKLWPIYSALAYHRLMIAVDQEALKSYYANRPNQLAKHLKEYIASNGKKSC